MPTALVPGVKMPLWIPPPGAVHVPFNCGEQPSLSMSAKAEALEQVENVALQPAFEVPVTATVTVALAEAHGGTPATM